MRPRPRNEGAACGWWTSRVSEEVGWAWACGLLVVSGPYFPRSFFANPAIVLRHVCRGIRLSQYLQIRVPGAKPSCAFRFHL